MKAEDTLMSDKILLQKLLGLPNTSTITEYAAQQDMNQPPGSYFKAGAKAQVEVSFKAGQEEELKKHKDITSFYAGKREGRLQGLKEARE